MGKVFVRYIGTRPTTLPLKGREVNVGPGAVVDATEEECATVGMRTLLRKGRVAIDPVIEVTKETAISEEKPAADKKKGGK